MTVGASDEHGHDPVYWYAPFDNAGELALAGAAAPLLGRPLVVQSCSERFGSPLPLPPGLPYRLVRDLPPPAGEGGGSRSPWARWEVARRRSARRRSLVDGTAPAVVHLHTFNVFTDWYAVPGLRAPGRVVVQSVHNVRGHDSPLPGPVEHRLLRRGYLAADRLVVAHEHLAGQLVDDFAVPAERIAVIPIPTLPGSFDPRPPDAGRRATTFLFFGTFRRNKGIDILLDAVASLAGEPELRFVFAGRGDPDCEGAVRRAAARDRRITAEVGYVDATRRAELYRDADVVVMPYTEMPAQSGVLHDAYGAARPCIVADVGPLGASVRAEGTGWVFRPGDRGELAAAIRRAAADQAGRVQRGEAARAVCASRVPERIAARFVALYEQVGVGA